MKVKTFAVTFILFLSVLFSCLLLISILFFRIQVNSAMERSGNEHFFISDSMGKELKNLLERGAEKEASIKYLYDDYSKHYAGQNRYIEIFKDEDILYSSFPYAGKGVLYYDSVDENRTAVLKKLGDKEYVIVSGDIPQTKRQYKIQYIYDITPIILMYEKLRNFLLFIGAGFSFLAAVLLLFFLNILFRPFSQVVAVSKEIASGNYEKRIRSPGSGEIAEMADSFNNMAEKVQEAVKQLSEEAKQKQQFIDDFSHEIRTPLTSVCGFAEYIQKSAIDEKEKITVAGYIVEDGNYILSIANRLLALATMKNGNIELRKCLVKELFNNAEKLLDKRLETKGIQLKKECFADSLYGDKDLLQSLLVNLTNNAIDASSCNAVILWQTYRDKEKIILSVTDHGCGIEQEQLNKISEPFYRVDKARNRESGNAGLGLSICQKIADCHNAQIVMESKINEGTVVKVIFTSS